MKIPIPDDWTGDWTCVEIQWPNSPKWISLLLGLTGSPSQGRYWDGRTGTITDAQEVGREIFQRNYPLKPCQICNGDDEPPVIAGGDGSGGDDEDDMSNVTWISIEDGVLYQHFGPCCKLAVGDLSTVDTPGTEGEPDTETPSTWACNKARGMADQWGAMLRLGIDALQITAPGSVIAAAPYQQAWKAALPSFVYDEAILWQAMVWYSTGALDLEIEQAIESEVFEDNLACVWSPQLLSTSGLGIDEWGRQKSSLQSQFSSNVATFLALMLTATRFPIFSYWAQSYYGETGDCTCPEFGEGATEPTASGWYFTAPFAQVITCPGGFDSALATWFDNVDEDLYGIYFKYEWVSGDPINNIKRGNGDGGWTNYDVYMFGSNSDTHSVDIDYMQIGPNAFAEIGPLFPAPQRSALFAQSDSVPSPVIVKGQIALAHLQGTAQGDPASVDIRFTMRWLFNINSASHQ